MCDNDVLNCHKENHLKNIPIIYGDILKERKRQFALWGDQEHTSLEWLAILMEEVGESATDVMKLPDFGEEVQDLSRYFTKEDTEKLEGELVQVAAVCVAWLEDIRRNRIEKETPTEIESP